MTTTTDAGLEAAIAAELAELGATADEVYSSLKAAGITGWPDDTGNCPVANLLLRKLSREFPLTDSHRVSVDTPTVHCSVKNRTIDAVVEAHAVAPQPVAEFIKRFDAGTHYRDLMPNYDPAPRAPALPPDDTDIEE